MRKSDKLLGTLDLLVLRILAGGDTMHGCAIADRIHEVSRDALRVEEGSLYPALHRMEETGWVTSDWKPSANNRRARYYRITSAGKRRVAAIEREWTAHVNAVMRLLKLA
jgi:PadR family transcriptional regulator PadR